MTVKEIIDGLKFTVDMFLFNPSTGETYTEPRNDMDKTTIDACKGAIELLEQVLCEDCISRQKAIDTIEALYLDGDNVVSYLANVDGDTLIGKYQAITALDDLPSVVPYPRAEKTAEWIDLGDTIQCPNCKTLYPKVRVDLKHYCERCGIRTEGIESAEQTETEVKQTAFDILDQKLTEEYDKAEGMEKRTLKMVFEFMSEAICEAEQTYDWCKGCKEYDTKKHCCHRYSSFIRYSLQDNINAVLEEIKKTLQEMADDIGEDKGLECAIEVIEDYIENHKGEIVEKPTAEWEWVQYESLPDFGNYHCSNCRHIEHKIDGYKYCPNCGRRMKGGEK